MDDRDNYIEPVQFIGAGMCYKCGGHLTIKESEVYEIKVTNAGVPIDLGEELYECIGICNNCKAEYPMVKTRDRFLPDSDIKYAICEELLVNEYNRIIKKREQECRDRMAVNPFGYNEDDEEYKGGSLNVL